MLNAASLFVKLALDVRVRSAKMDTLVILISAVIGGVFYYFHTRLMKAHTFWKSRNVAGPEPVYLLGNIKETVLRKKFFGQLIGDYYHQFPNEKYVGIYVISNPVLIVRDLDLIKNILVKDFEYFTNRGVEYSKDGLSTNLFHADGDTWSLLRKRLTPMFSSGKIKNMLYLVNESSDLFIKFINDNFDTNREWKLNELTARFTISVICASAFGLEANTLTNGYNMFLDYGDRLFRPSWKVFIETFVPGVMKDYDLSFFDNDIITFFYKLTRKLLSEREGKPKTRNDFVDMLIEMKEEGQIHGNRIKMMEQIKMDVTESVLAAQILLFFAAGFETTSTTMAFLLHELAVNQDVQDKIIEEVDEVFEKYEGKLVYESFTDLKYLDMAISETLRKYPVVEPLQRQTVADYKVPGDELVIPKGTLIFIPAVGVQMDPKYYPDPEKFDPDRFSQENKNQRHPMAFLPFGEGPRVCIGMRFARVEILVALSNFFRRFRVVPSKSTKIKMEYTSHRLVLQPKGGLYAGIVRR